MQGSSSPELPLLYSTAVTVRFFDAAPLALFAAEHGFVLFKGAADYRAGHRSRDLCGAQAWKPVFQGTAVSDRRSRLEGHVLSCPKNLGADSAAPSIIINGGSETAAP